MRFSKDARLPLMACRRPVARFPRVGNAQSVQQAGFGHFHAAGVAGMVVIVAQQMQRAMHDQMRQVMRHAPARRRRLAPDDAKRQHQFRRRMLIGQHVGGFVASAVPRVQLAHQPVVREHHADAQAAASAAPRARPATRARRRAARIGARLGP